MCYLGLLVPSTPHARQLPAVEVEWVGSLLHTAGEDGTVKVWNVSDSPDDYLTCAPPATSNF